VVTRVFQTELSQFLIKVTAKTGLSRKLTRELRCVKRVDLQIQVEVRTV
jgi:hypothetical protein